MGVPKEIVQLIFELLPGFFTAWVLYGLTAYKRPSPFERVVEALVFTIIIQGLVWLIRSLALLAGQVISIGTWMSAGELPLAVAIALALGLVLAWCANSNVVHRWLWKRGVTSGSSYPSEWYKTFMIEKRWVILDLKDGRRLYGWPMDWPDHPDEGHVVLSYVEWIGDNGTRIPLPEVHKMTIAVADIEFVEFLKNPNEPVPEE